MLKKLKLLKNFVKPEIIKTEDFSKQVEESLTPPDIEKKIEERLAEIVKEPIKKKNQLKEILFNKQHWWFTQNFRYPIEEEDKIEEETIIEHKPRNLPKKSQVSYSLKQKKNRRRNFTCYREKNPITEVLPVIEELTVSEITDEKLPEIIEESKLIDTFSKWNYWYRAS